METGKIGDGLRRAGSLAERASAAGDRVAELCGRINEGVCRISLEPEGATDQLAALVEQALPVFEAAGDELALYTAYSALGVVANIRAQMDAVLNAYERADAHARRAGLPYELFRWRAYACYWGTAPVSELLALLDEQEARGGPNLILRLCRGGALAMLGRFDEARAMLAEARAELADRGGGMPLATAKTHASVVAELLAGNPAAAAEFGEEGCKLLDELGEQSVLSTAAGMLAQALYALDRLEEADGWAGLTSESVLSLLWIASMLIPASMIS